MLRVTNALDYNSKVLIVTVKSFVVRDPRPSKANVVLNISRTMVVQHTVKDLRKKCLDVNKTD